MYTKYLGFRSFYHERANIIPEKRATFTPKKDLSSLWLCSFFILFFFFVQRNREEKIQSTRESFCTRRPETRSHISVYIAYRVIEEEASDVRRSVKMHAQRIFISVYKQAEDGGLDGDTFAVTYGKYVTRHGSRDDIAVVCQLISCFANIFFIRATRRSFVLFACIFAFSDRRFFICLTVFSSFFRQETIQLLKLNKLLD